MSFSSGSSNSTSTTNTNYNNKSEPWKPTIPYLKGFLDKASSIGNIDITPDQQTAFGILKKTAAQGNPWDTSIANLANNQFNYSTAPQAGRVGEAYGDLQKQLSPMLNYGPIDLANNKELQGLLETVRGDISDTVNRQFAGAGRDLSGMNQQALARGISQGEAGLLLDQYNKEAARRDANLQSAASTLYGAGIGSANTQAELAAQQAGINAQGAQTAQQALDARNYGANQFLKLDQQAQQLPYENLALLGGLLFPAAGVGGSNYGNATSTTKSSGSSTGFGANIGSMLSDERAKEDIEEVGAMADGQKIYRYRYKGDPTVRVGPIAQEVEKRIPDAVDDNGPGGLKTVNMEAATDKAAQIVRKRMKKRG